MTKSASLAAAVLALLPTAVLADAESDGLAEVKAFTLEHTARLEADTAALQNAVDAYAAILAAHQGDYAAALAAEGPALAEAIKAIRAAWLVASNDYETIEGIVAGVPSTALFDLILDAGNPGTEAEDVADYDLVLPDGTVLHQPGSLFHSLSEPLFWGTDPAHLIVAGDVDGDGAASPGEGLFDVNLAQGVATGLVKWSGELDVAMMAWEPNRNDAFAAVVTMTPTVGDYFGEWKESQFINGKIGAFVAQSRLVDVSGIMGGCKRMYFSAVSPVVAAGDPEMDATIRAAFDELLALVEETRTREAAGTAFGAEEADALGSEAQDMADRIVAMVLQAAARHDVKLEG
ncbi:imelysin family protein [Gemmobacter denitrificans]|uniref:Imelysin family protein n=1 Tax=Gemmobacter denitrificans TaxID=3123040 RepID=A0ABU8BVS3_9RHOB